MRRSQEFQVDRPYLSAIYSSPMTVALAQVHAGVVEDVFRWLERVLAYHEQLTDFLSRLQSGAFIHASVESLLLARAATLPDCNAVGQRMC